MVFSGLSIAAESFWLFCSALLVNGVSSGFVQQYRFAAADRGTADFKPKAISIIMAGGIAAAIIGPQLVIFAGDLAAPVPFAGAFLRRNHSIRLEFCGSDISQPVQSG